MKLNDINANKGTINCGHCALRLDDNLRNGGVVNEKPVPKVSAKLFSTPIFEIENGKKTDRIRSSFVSDARILDRCAYPELSDQTLLKYDFTSDENGENPILDLTYEGQQQKTKKASIRLIKVKTQDKNNLKETLRCLSRTASDNIDLDGTAFGFIYRTHLNNVTIGHITNFFVDIDDTVYFIDAQDTTIRPELDLKGYQPDVFFVPSKPKDGYKIKKENIIYHYPEFPLPIKQEPNEMTDNADKILDNKRKRTETEDEDKLLQTSELKKTKIAPLSKDAFIEQIMNFAKEKNSVAINALMIETGYGLNVYGSSLQKNAIRLLAGQQEKQACEFLIQNHGASIEECAIGAAMVGNKELAEYFLLNIDVGNRNYTHLAAGAAFGGQKESAEYFLSKLEERRRNYIALAKTAASGGHKELVYFYLGKEQTRDQERETELVNIRRQTQEKDLVIKLLTEQNKQKELVIAQFEQKMAELNRIHNAKIQEKESEVYALRNKMPEILDSMRDAADKRLQRQGRLLNDFEKQVEMFKKKVGNPLMNSMDSDSRPSMPMPHQGQRLPQLGLSSFISNAPTSTYTPQATQKTQANNNININPLLGQLPLNRLIKNSNKKLG